jgi:uracil-DNA glycosylase family 4
MDQRIRRCTLCRLHQSRKKAVPGSGKIDNPDLMLVGEGPGRKEDELGIPFVGAAGRVLDSMLREAGIEKSQYYITNIVKCRPPENRKPFDDEVEICTSNYLEKQVELLNPKLICTLGVTALKYFTNKTSVGKNHGKLLRSKNSFPIFCTYHPAAIFRRSSLREKLRDDIRKIPSILKGLRCKRSYSNKISVLN